MSKEKVLVIAEAGVNHNGSLKLAIELVDAAIAAGADIVKFQTFVAEELASPQAKQAEYQTANTNVEQSQLSMLKSLELSFEEHKKVQEYCQSAGIEYLSTAFDFSSLNFLIEELQLKTLKIPSGELTNSPFVLAHAYTGCDLIVSTGMANLEEIEFALMVIAFGLVHKDDKVKSPSIEAFRQAYESEQGVKLLREKVTLLHCTTEYPAPIDEVNLKAMDLMRSHFKLNVGYSDHTQGTIISTAAVAAGAKVIEKHFTLSRELEGPDHIASIEPNELKEMIENIRLIEKALGSEVKSPTNSEQKNIAIARKSIVAKADIAKGDHFTESNLTIMRPGTGVSPTKFWQVIGNRAPKSFKAGDLIEV